MQTNSKLGAKQEKKGGKGRRGKKGGRGFHKKRKKRVICTNIVQKRKGLQIKCRCSAGKCRGYPQMVSNKYPAGYSSPVILQLYITWKYCLLMLNVRKKTDVFFFHMPFNFPLHRSPCKRNYNDAYAHTGDTSSPVYTVHIDYSLNPPAVFNLEFSSKLRYSSDTNSEIFHNLYRKKNTSNFLMVQLRGKKKRALPAFAFSSLQDDLSK